MFDNIVERYDLLNRLLSLGQDRRWRRELVRNLSGADGPVLDLCCGTGDVALEFLRRAPGCTPLVAADFSGRMCDSARGKLSACAPAGARWNVARADALGLPFADRSFGAAGVAFGVRNFARLDRGLSEIHRVLAPGGQLAVLEFAPPQGAFLRAVYRPYLRLAVPLAGKLLAGSGAAYGYLSSSIQAFLSPERMLAALAEAGFARAEARPLTFGVTILYTARRN
ncbi:ubiquinone/menaquinone biosynthesis methyltransferase [bacterium]|nr:ubiquinone/menaquinone biosynthesis methyltransferase [bacterium]